MMDLEDYFSFFFDVIIPAFIAIFLSFLTVVTLVFSLFLIDSLIHQSFQYRINSGDDTFYSNKVEKKGNCIVLDNGYICGTYSVENNPNYKGVK